MNAGAISNIDRCIGSLRAREGNGSAHEVGGRPGVHYEVHRFVRCVRGLALPQHAHALLRHAARDEVLLHACELCLLLLQVLHDVGKGRLAAFLRRFGHFARLPLRAAARLRPVAAEATSPTGEVDGIALAAHPITLRE